ncbi:hypothetical protein [Baaleninema simplex]|uniref:hypothetical protein n=1 Tax=Baaleninema simplex TaxID=2862350 RepID=UPI00035EE387|nr:hypothetical protein [Baaleninema simplex]
MNPTDDFSDLSVEENLSDIAAELLSSRRNEDFLERLFSVESGKWIDMPPLCKGLIEIEEQLEEAGKSFREAPQVTWLPYSSPCYEQGFCIIIFFVEDLHWSSVALYNKNYFHETFRNKGKEDSK